MGTIVDTDLHQVTVAGEMVNGEVEGMVREFLSQQSRDRKN